MGARDDGDKAVRARERDGKEASALGDDFGAARVHEYDRGNWTSSGAVRASLSDSSTNEKVQAVVKIVRARQRAHKGDGWVDSTSLVFQEMLDD